LKGYEMSIQAIITADNHLDPPATSFGIRRFERKRDHLRCFEEVIEHARKNRPDLLLMAGDIFDVLKPSNTVRAKVMQHFRELYDIGVRIVLIGGQHDTPKSAEEGASPLAVYGNSGYAIFFQDFTKLAAVSFRIGGTEVVVAGLGYNPLLTPAQDPLSQTGAEIHGRLNILLLHYPVEGFVGVYGVEPTVKLASIPKQFQLVAAGHLHRYQKKLMGNTLVVCPGSTERADFTEEDEPKGFVWAELSKEGTVSVEHIRTQARPYRTLELPFPEEEPMATLKQRLDENRNADLVLRLTLRGAPTAEQLSSYKRSELILYGQERFFHLFVDDSKLDIREPEPLRALPRTSPLEELRRYFRDAMEQASLEEREILEEALRLSEAELQEAGAW